MAQSWVKEFWSWETPHPVHKASRVRTALKNVFGNRYSELKGGSHQFKVSVPELREIPKFSRTFLLITVKNGQRVRGWDLREPFEAAIELAGRGALILPDRPGPGSDEDEDESDGGETDETNE